MYLDLVYDCWLRLLLDPMWYMILLEPPRQLKDDTNLDKHSAWADGWLVIPSEKDSPHYHTYQSCKTFQFPPFGYLLASLIWWIESNKSDGNKPTIPCSGSWINLNMHINPTNYAIMCPFSNVILIICKFTTVQVVTCTFENSRKIEIRNTFNLSS